MWIAVVTIARAVVFLWVWSNEAATELGSLRNDLIGTKSQLLALQPRFRS